MDEYKTSESNTEETNKSLEENIVQELEQIAEYIRDAYSKEEFGNVAEQIHIFADLIHDILNNIQPKAQTIQKIKDILINTELASLIGENICNKNKGVLFDCVHLLYSVSFNNDLLLIFAEYDILAELCKFFLTWPRSKWLEIIVVITSLIKFQTSIDDLISHFPDIQAKLSMYPGGIMLYVQLSNQLLMHFPDPNLILPIVDGFCTIVDDLPFPETYDCISRMIHIEENVCELIIERNILQRIVDLCTIQRMKSEDVSSPMRIIAKIALHCESNVISQYGFLYSVAEALINSDVENKIISGIKFIISMLPDNFNTLITFVTEDNLLGLIASFMSTGSLKLKKNSAKLMCKLIKSTNESIISLSIVYNIPKLMIPILENDLADVYEILTFYLITFQYVDNDIAKKDEMINMLNEVEGIDAFHDCYESDNDNIHYLAEEVLKYVE
ncbi:hypothetical protein TVAG_232530 [Trichomonas vaginalis G3]|uniref:Uncharacterized protein n=1 Tax=Trichomonas vaginalis (strain ATCC PRA-98 / G3) TaxID=412133 RepID=A2EU83_TRIV3|nr:hypothetical protein TVAGG3_1051380 [Trichomonas vaginalis G3]EAY03770.1 hypothetical protein TVAG_232530 [Trichomonas vaginalis G3]KAI5494223.1 hypothetical protein TVAGG3_1051380 [Trichomonas vaginalis G3]|eukprot:XP_001315993.1 hypothetical protein [Trichomonas vaginalis G3]